MSAQLAWLGAVALGFGLAAGLVGDPADAFARLHVLGGGVALAVAGALSLRQLQSAATPLRRGLAPALLRVLLVAVGAVAAERLLAYSGTAFERPSEQRGPDAALLVRLDRLCEPIEILHFSEPADPRARHTARWLEALAEHERIDVRSLDLAQAPPEAHHYSVVGSNRLVLVRPSAPGRVEHVASPGDGTLFEALGRICADPSDTLLWLAGEGEGDPEDAGPGGYTGLAAALESEGVAWRRAFAAGLERVPDRVSGVLVVAPERPLPAGAVDALDHYLARGGRLVALLEPQRDSGLEPLLERWGIASPPERVVDPPPGARGADAPPGALVVHHWESHPIAAGLGTARAAFLPGARSFALRKPRPEDRLDPVAWSGPDARLAGEGGETTSRHLPVAVAGRFPRRGAESRIFAAGDADFAANAHLRSVYNLDLAANGILWALAREGALGRGPSEDALALRPKLRETRQFPLPTRDAVRGFQNLGLLIPELLLAAGGVVTLRRRAA